jgi:UDP-2,3-diacylglucosamine hydrolase
MSDKIYFVSDIHFGAESAAKEFNKRRLLDHFLNEIVLKDSKKLYIVGDLFDFWFEYKNVVLSEHHEVIRILSNAVKRGLEVHYIAGNHDFWLGDYLEKRVGIHIHPDPEYIEFQGKQFYLCHGDGVAKRDRGYRLLKRVLRNKVNIKLYRWLHPDLGVPLAKWVSGSSRKYTDNIDLKDHDDYLEFAQKHLEEKADFVLMGHRHNPLRENFEGLGTYINLGDWLFNFTYAYFENGDIHLSNLKDKMAALREETDQHPHIIPQF